jgi:hypothetical protein
MKGVAAKLVEMARGGHLPAIKELLEPTLGRPLEADFLERLELLEKHLMQAQERGGSMMRDRLKRLEKLLHAAAATCLGCAKLRAVILLPGEPEPTEPVRCTRCGREHPPAGIPIVVPGLAGPQVAVD